MTNENNNVRKLPRLTIYKPHKSGNGGVLSLELHPACGDVKGYLKVIAAPQGVGEGRFDWDSRIETCLSVMDVFSILPVLKGEAASACIKTRSADGTRYLSKVIRLSNGGCAFGVGVGIPVEEGGENDDLTWVELARHEAFGVACAVENALGRLAFGG